MNILFPILGFIKSGGFRVLTKIANDAKHHNCEVTFVCPAEENEPYFPNNANVIYIDKLGKTINRNEKNRHVVKGWRKLTSLYLYLKKNSKNYDAVVASSNLTSYPIWLGSSSANYYYIQAYEPEMYSDIKFLPRRITLEFAAWLSYFLPLEKIVNSKLYTNFNNIKANHVVYPGIDLSIFYKKETNLPENNNRPWIVGCIGRKEIWKGSHDVAEAIKILSSTNKQIELRVAFNSTGYGKEKLLNPHGDNNLADYYRSLDILVAPAHLQLGAIHYPVLEAMACGAIVITTGYEPATEENAYIVPIKSPKEIAATIKKIINDPKEAQLKVIRAVNDVQRFSWNLVTKKFYGILKEKNK